MTECFPRVLLAAKAWEGKSFLSRYLSLSSLLSWVAFKIRSFVSKVHTTCQVAVAALPWLQAVFVFPIFSCTLIYHSLLPYSVGSFVMLCLGALAVPCQWVSSQPAYPELAGITHLSYSWGLYLTWPSLGGLKDACMWLLKGQSMTEASVVFCYLLDPPCLVSSCLLLLFGSFIITVLSVPCSNLEWMGLGQGLRHQENTSSDFHLINCQCRENMRMQWEVDTYGLFLLELLKI